MTSKGISRTPGVCGGEACIGKTRIPVWLLATYFRDGLTDDEVLENYPSLNTADLLEARLYIALYPRHIERGVRQWHVPTPREYVPHNH